MTNMRSFIRKLASIHLIINESERVAVADTKDGIVAVCNLAKRR
jgi:hypothetical protein